MDVIDATMFFILFWDQSTVAENILLICNVGTHLHLI